MDLLGPNLSFAYENLYLAKYTYILKLAKHNIKNLRACTKYIHKKQKKRPSFGAKIIFFILVCKTKQKWTCTKTQKKINVHKKKKHVGEKKQR